MRILILGGTGFVGFNLKKYLSGFYDVAITSRSGASADLAFDIADERSYSGLNDNFDIVINCIVDYNSSLEQKIKSDVLYKMRLLEQVAKKGSHYIEVSSVFATEENKTLSDYNFAKFLSDEIVCYVSDKANLRYSILRYPQIFDLEEKGRVSQKGFYYFIDTFRQQQILNVFGNAEAKRSYMPVEVLVKTVHEAIKKKIMGIHNVVMPDAYSANDLITEFRKSITFPDKNISYQPGRAAMEYSIPGCSVYFEEFLSQQPGGCAYYFKKLLTK